MKNLLIIGAGNMGAALCQGLQSSLPDLAISIADHNEKKLGSFPGVRTSTNAIDLLDDADSVLIAVKPQAFDALAAEVKDRLSTKIIVSIMAGKSLATLQEKTGSTKIIRAMPNLGVQVGRGMTAWIASPTMKDTERAIARTIFEAVGKEMEVQSEEMIDAFTACAGCGPGYFFHLCDLITKKAVILGFSEQEARLLSEETLIASGKLLETGEKSAAAWVSAVASKGGATEAALRHLEASKADEQMMEAMEKARERLKELGA